MPGRGWALLAAMVAASPAAAQPALPAHPPPILGAPVPPQVETARPNITPIPPTPIAGTPIPASYVDPPSRPASAPTTVRAARLGAPVASDGSDTAPSLPPTTPSGPATGGDWAWPPLGDGRSNSPPSDRDFPFRKPEPRTDWSINKFFGSDLDRDPAKPAKPQWNFSKLFDSKSNWQPGENLEGLFGQRGDWFRSDHAFDGFISPVTNPFLFEDPRSLTEVRPVVIYQKMPDSQVDFRGGSITYFGLQGRLAVTDRLSFVFSKLGGIWVSPGSGSAI
ncbi:MAG TPA: hypothetical protein VGI99_05105, partial [Gemmataceae bacterium]